MQPMPDCPSCHRPLPPSGLCGQCLLARMAEVECAPVRRLGDYELLEELDHGGMGVVWRARHRELGRVVALKVIRGGAAAGESEIVRFRTEAEAVARLDHPGIVPVFELGEVDGVPFFTMPLLTGGTLQRRLEHAERMPPREAAALMVQVARAVAHAHERGVLHRDLKPANVLLDEAGVPRVADFGLARFLESDSALTRTGTTLGTPAYAAPEQLRGDAPTTAGDVFSLGGILYHLLGGSPPRDARDPLTALQTAAREDPGPLCLPRGNSSRDLQIITMRCLQRDPASRYGGAAALAEDLERWLRGEPILARAASLPERVWKWMRRRPALAALIAVGALSLAAVFVQQIISERRVRAESQAARRAEAAAVRAAAELEENLYAADMSLGMRAAAERNQSLIRRILARHAGRGVAQTRRGFEFSWLSAVAEQDAAVVLRGHTGSVNALAVTPDGSLLASAGADGFLRLWRLPGGEPAGTFPQKANRENDPAFLADKLAAGSRLARFPGLLKQVLHDPEQITIMTSRATAGYLGSINTLSFSRDGTLLAAAGTTALTKVWSVPQGTLLQVFPLIHSQAVFHPGDDRLFITSGYDLEYRSGRGSVSVWNGRTGEPVPGEFGSASLPGVFTQGGNVISFPDGDRGIRALNAADGTLIFHNQNSNGHHLLALAAAPDGSMGATTDTRGPEVLVAHSDSRHLVPLACGSTIPGCLAWAPDSSLLAAGCPDHRVRLWSRDLREQPPLLGHEGAVRAVVFTPDGGMLCSACADGTVRLWNLRRQPEPVPYQGLDARLLARDDMLLGCANDSAVLWRDGTPVFITSHDPRSHDWPLGWSADGSRAAVFRYTGRDHNSLMQGEGELRWHSTLDGSLLSTVPLGPQRQFRSAALSPDGTVLITSTSVSADGTNLLRRDAQTGAVTAVCHVDMVAASVLAFTADGTRLTASDGSSHLAVLDADTFRILWERKQGAPSLLRVPGALAVAAAEQIHLLNPDTGAELAVLSGHAGRVLHLALHPDGRTLASASADRTIRLWHLPTRQEMGTLHSGMDAPASSLTFTADGTRLIAGQRSGAALVFDAPQPKPAPSPGNPPFPEK